MSSPLATLAANPVAQKTYTRVLESGRVPRRSFAHYFMNTDGIRSRIHLQNFYSTFFPDSLTEANAHVWLFDSDGRLVAKRTFAVPPFGQLYLEIEDIAGADLDVEGMVFIDFEPPSVVRKQLKTIPGLAQLTVQTPFWVSYHDSDDNYMYVHSIEQYRGKVWGSIAPVRWLMERATPVRESWRSWRLLDTALLDELQIIAMNHARIPGSTRVGVIRDTGEWLWSEQVDLTTRQSRRMQVPQAKIAEWRDDPSIANVRVALDPLLSENGKPYVIMRYGGGPWSLHHG